MGPFPHDAPKSTISDENPVGTDGFEFIEFAHPDPQELRDLFARMGYSLTAVDVNKSSCRIVRGATQGLEKLHRVSAELQGAACLTEDRSTIVDWITEAKESQASEQQSRHSAQHHAEDNETANDLSTLHDPVQPPSLAPFIGVIWPDYRADPGPRGSTARSFLAPGRRVL